jgi:hypothetical protein
MVGGGPDERMAFCTYTAPEKAGRNWRKPDLAAMEAIFGWRWFDRELKQRARWG